MNIILVSREYPPSRRVGGIGYYVRDIANALIAHNAKVWVISASDETDEYKEYTDNNGAKIIRLPGGDFCAETMNPIKSRIIGKIRSITRYHSYRQKVAEKINELHTQQKIDVIEFAEYGNESFIWLKKFNNIPSIIRLHGPTILDRNSTTTTISPFKSPLMKIFGELELQSLHLASAITSPSAAMANWVAKRKKNIEIELISNSINVNWWKENSKPKIIPESLNDKNNIIHLFSAGTISLGKGHKELFEAVYKLREEGLNIHLTLAGRLTKFGHHLKNVSELKQYKNWFKVHDFLDQLKLAQYYSEAHLTVFPSRWEPFGLVCAEAMACGALVLASDAGGMKEIIENEKHGFLITPCDSELLAKKIVSICEISEAVKNRIRRNAQERAITHFDINQIARQQINFYNKIIRERKL